MQTDKIVMGQMHGSRRLSAFLKSGDRRILIHRKVLTLNEEWSVSMIEVDTGQLKRAVEAQHACTATLIQSVPVKETFEDETVWEGIVHVFKINGHPRARMAYAWSSPIEGSDKRRFFAVLHQPPVTSPGEAVRAAIVAERWIK